MSLNEQRIYVQMRPDNKAGIALAEIGKQHAKHTKAGRLIGREELHVTVIHFGKAADVLRVIRDVVELSDEEYIKRLQAYIDAMRMIVTDDEYELTPIGYGRFGKNGTTVVARYDASEALVAIHTRAYAELLRFIESCGITDPEKFANNDPNFRVAAVFKPHITLYKGYDGPDIAALLPSCRVTFTPLVYDNPGN